MKYILVAIFLFVSPAVLAYSPEAVEVDQPFDEIVIPMEGEAQKQSYLGTLETYPHLYEFTLTEKTALEIKTRQRDTEDAEPVNLILLSVHPDTERISEVVRQNKPIAERTKVFVRPLGISVYESEWLEVELEPGLYRLEVSTPLNESSYELDFGEESVDNNYFGTFSAIWQVQRHFDYSWIRFVLSTYVLYQIGIVLLVGAIYYTWRMRRNSVLPPAE